MAKWKPGPPKTDAIIRAGREAKAYRVSLAMEKQYKRGMRLYSIVPLLLGVLASFAVAQVFFAFILPLMISFVQGFSHYPNFYTAAIYGFGTLIFLASGQLLAYRFSEKLVAGLTPLDEGLSLLQQRAEAVRQRGKLYVVGLIAIAGGSIYLAVDIAKIWNLLAAVCVALLIERFVLPGRVAIPELPDQPKD